MLDIVIGTTTQRMDKAIIEVFDKLTATSHENRHGIAGYKTNSHFLFTKKFIIENLCWQDQRWYKGKSNIESNSGNMETVEDLLKALCYVSGDNYDDFISLYKFINYPYKLKGKDGWLHDSYGVIADHNSQSILRQKESFYKRGIEATIVEDNAVYGEWFEWAYFRVKAFKKGTMHFEFLDEDLWARLNQRIAKIKGYPLFEGKEQTAYQNRQTGRTTQPKKRTTVEPSILFSFAV